MSVLSRIANKSAAPVYRSSDEEESFGCELMDVGRVEADTLEAEVDGVWYDCKFRYPDMVYASNAVAS